MSTLHLEELHSRLCPAPLDPSAFVPGYAARYGIVGTAEDANGFLPNGRAFHAVAGLSEGNGPRVVVEDATTGEVLSSFDAFPDDFRGGIVIESVRVKDAWLITAAPGIGGGPVVTTFDPLGGLVSSKLVFPESFRGGISYLSATTLPGDASQTVFATPGAGGAPVLAGVNPTTGEVVVNILIGPAKDRSGLWQPVPGSLGADVAPGTPGLLVQQGGDPGTTRAVGFDGTFYS